MLIAEVSTLLKLYWPSTNGFCTGLEGWSLVPNAPDVLINYYYCFEYYEGKPDYSK
jgi:hypothetical protein